MGLPGDRIDCRSTGICGCKIITATIQLRLCNPALALGAFTFLCYVLFFLPAKAPINTCRVIAKKRSLKSSC